MTTAPPRLLDVRRLLLAELGPHGLSSAEVGIVGDSAHRGGYHCGRDRLDATRDYSVIESPRDRAGLTLYASALDVGTFAVRRAGRVYDLAHFSRWLADQCARGAADCRDIREVIYSPDGKVVRRFDRLGRRASGDDSHLWHTHISYFRDATEAGRDQTPVVRRYLAAIGLIERVDDVSAEEVWDGTKWIGNDGKTAYTAGSWLRNANMYAARAWEEAKAVRAGQAAILAAVQGVDTAAILARIDEVAAADQQRTAELLALVRQAQSGRLDAAEVVDLIAERLAAGSGQAAA